MFVSAEDRLVAANSPQLVGRMRRLAQSSGEIAVDLSREVSRLQQRIERRSFAARRQLFARDRWVEELLDRLSNAT
jgi:preprotein translocase subunit SecA